MAWKHFMHSHEFVTSGRAELSTHIVGQGRPVVFLHASVSDHRMWWDQLDSVGENGMAVAYDRRGYGETRSETESYSPVADLMAVLEHVSGDQSAILVGCSQGGKIAIDAALQHPSRIAGLVLIAPSISGSKEPVYTPEIHHLISLQRNAEKAGDFDLAHAIKARLWLDGPLATEGRVQGQARELFSEMNRAAEQAGAVGENLDVASAFDRLAEIHAPTLVMWGDLDFPHIQERSRWIAQTIPNGKTCEIAGAAHLPSLEQPRTVTARLVIFLKDTFR